MHIHYNLSSQANGFNMGGHSRPNYRRATSSLLHGDNYLARRIILINDDAFLSTITHNLMAIESAIRVRNEQLGLSNTGDFTAEADKDIRSGFKAMDENNSGDVDWDEVATTLEGNAARGSYKNTHNTQVDDVMLHNTIRILLSNSKTDGNSVDEEDWVKLLAKKARGELGASAGAKEAAQRHHAVVGMLLRVDQKQAGELGSNALFTSLLKNQNISTDLIEEEEEKEEDASINPFNFLKQPTFVVPCCSHYLQLAKMSQWVVHRPEFGAFIMCCIIMIGCMEAANTYQEDEPLLKAREASLLISENTKVSWADVLDDVMLCVFVMEMLMKIVAEGDRPWAYWFGPTEPSKPDGDSLERSPSDHEEVRLEGEKAQNKVVVINFDDGSNEGVYLHIRDFLRPHSIYLLRPHLIFSTLFPQAYGIALIPSLCSHRCYASSSRTCCRWT
jgi:hypothetical protein